MRDCLRKIRTYGSTILASDLKPDSESPLAAVFSQYEVKPRTKRFLFRLYGLWPRSGVYSRPNIPMFDVTIASQLDTDEFWEIFDRAFPRRTRILNKEDLTYKSYIISIHFSGTIHTWNEKVLVFAEALKLRLESWIDKRCVVHLSNRFLEPPPENEPRTTHDRAFVVELTCDARAVSLLESMQRGIPHGLPSTERFRSSASSHHRSMVAYDPRGDPRNPHLPYEYKLTNRVG